MKLQERLFYTGISFALRSLTLTSILTKLFERRIKKSVDERADLDIPHVRRMKSRFLSNLLIQSIKNIRKGYFSFEYAMKVKSSFVGNQTLNNQRKHAKSKYIEKYGIEPPGFCTISPTQRCNLKCIGCYAASHSYTPATLDYDVFRKFLGEMRDTLGARFIVVSGGEPFIYKSKGKTLLDIIEEFNDMFFLVYTNGTLLSDEVVARIFEAGNLTPAISVEGYEKETDERRGKGVYKRIMNSLERLKKYGVPFGFSVTATKKNIDILLEDRFYEYYFEEIGATYMWMFHLMPIGRAKETMDLMLSPEERVALYYQIEKMLFEKRYFVGDFWNSGAASNGCIAYGRANGYFYVDWNGNIMPCVFVPYYKDNLYELYKNDKSIINALMSDLFLRGRKWQMDYGYYKKAPDNWLAPCSIRDHYDNFRKNILTEDAKPEDENAKAALEDPEYYRRMVEFGERLYEISKPIWEKRISI